MPPLNSIGWLLFDKKIVALRLANSDDLWKQRIAIIATLSFIRRDDFYIPRNFQDIVSSYDLIHKAVGWMIRRLVKTKMWQ